MATEVDQDVPVRYRRTKSVSRAEDLQQEEARVRRSQPDKPWVLIHHFINPYCVEIHVAQGRQLVSIAKVYEVSRNMERIVWS